MAKATVLRLIIDVKNLSESQSGQVSPDGFHALTSQSESADRLGVEGNLDAFVWPNAEVHDRGDLFVRRATLDGQFELPFIQVWQNSIAFLRVGEPLVFVK